eukprot:XP_001701875.1 predicted protein [Chlamydomonas reinhardtii]
MGAGTRTRTLQSPWLLVAALILLVVPGGLAQAPVVAQCTGKAGPPGEMLDVSVDATGALSGKGTAVGYSKDLTVSVSGTTCADSFTGLPVPFALVAPWASPASFVDGVSGIVIVTAAATACGKDAPASAASDAATLYGKVVSELNAPADATRAAEFVSVPLEAAALAARVLAVVQTRGVAAAANWAAELDAVSISRAAISSTLAVSPVLPSTAVNLRLNVRAAGPLSQCPVSYKDFTSPTSPRSPTTSDAGVVSMSQVTVGIATVPGGCKDNALSSVNRTVSSKFSMRALLPPGVENAALDVVAYLASAVFTMDQARSLKEESAPPRLINVDDYKKVYNALGVTDALPAGTDFARQNWVSTTLTGANLIARAYFLNQKLQGALGPTCGFLAGLTRGKRTVDDVAASFVDRLASDLIDGTLRLDDKTYLNGLMRAYLTNGANLPVTFPSAKFGSSAVGRRLLQADPTATDDLLSFDLEQLGALLDSVATAVADSSNKLVQLEQEVAAAAASGTPVNIAEKLQQAAQVASVQQSSLSDSLTTLAQEVAAAVAANDTAALATKLQSATDAIKADYAPEKLTAMIQSAQVNTAAIKTVAEAGTAVDPAPPSSDSGSGISSGAIAVSGGWDVAAY